MGAAVAAGKGGERRRLEGKGFYSRECVLRREWRIQVNSTGTLLGGGEKELGRMGALFRTCFQGGFFSLALGLVR